MNLKLKELFNMAHLLDDIEQSINSDNVSAWSDLVYTLINCLDIADNENVANMPVIKNTAEAIISELKNGNINQELVSAWAFNVKCTLTLIMAKNIVKLHDVEEEYFEAVIEYFNDERYPCNISAVCNLAISEMYNKTDSLTAYHYGIKAFEIDPAIGAAFGKEYIYNNEKIQENYYEACPICGSGNCKPFKSIKQFAAVKDQECFSPYKLWMKCFECDNLFAYNFPVMKMGDINGHYTKKFTEDCIVPRYGLRIYSDIFNKCREFTQGKRYFEIGIGGGEMLAAALEFGYDVKAVEICKEDCEKVSSILDVDIIWSDFMKLDLDEKFDIIVMGDVLEHVSDPVGALKKAVSLLGENGVLWVSTPNYKSGFSRLMKDSDAMWNQLNHFTYFSYDGLNKILNSMGLSVKHYDISNRYNGSMELYIQKN